MGRVVGCSGCVVYGISRDRVVGGAVEINSMSSTSEDVIAGYHVINRCTASVIEGDSMIRRPRNRVSGNYVVLGDACAITHDDAPAVAVEVISRDGISLSAKDVHSVVRAGEDGVARYRFSPGTAQVETIAIVPAYISGHRVVVAGTVVYAVTV